MRQTLRALLFTQAGGLLGASAGSLLAAALEAHWALQDLSFGRLFLVEWGLMGPLALALGVTLGLFRSVLLPHSTKFSWREWRAARPELSLALALSPLLATLFLVESAQLALLLLSAGLPEGAAGTALALGVALFAVIQVLALTGLCRLAERRAWRLPSPLVCLLVSLVLSGGILALSIARGSTSGAGGPLAIFGVLRREELDLRPVLLASLLLIGGAVWPSPRTSARAAAFVALSLLPLFLTLYASGSGLGNPKLALAVERGAPLGSRLLGTLRHLTDRDGDGFSPRFGGGDCDDGRAQINPGANDRPNNGMDEDCSGADALPARREPIAPKAPVDVRALALSRVPERLNVVLITIDTLRYDLGFMGNPRPLSPRLDQLSRESIVFEKAYALASYTSKSLPPMLIGKYAGETHRGYTHFNRFDKNDTFLAERLAAAKIRSISVQGHWYFFQNYGMERGFDVVNIEAAPKAAQVVEGDRTSNSDRLSDAFISELQKPELEREQFFMWAHYTDPHAEYVPHDGIDFGKDSRALYDGEVAYVDREIGRVLDKLRSLPFWDRTSVIVTSDHGEAFREHGMIRHGFELWEELVRVPLLVRVPGLGPGRVRARRSLIDVVPTILELQRVALPEGEGRNFLSGQSLLLDFTLTEPHASSSRPVFIDMAEGPYNAERRALIEGDEKVILSNGRVLGLFDLEADPGEKHDLSADAARRARALERYRAFRQTLREVPVPRR